MQKKFIIFVVVFIVLFSAGVLFLIFAPTESTKKPPSENTAPVNTSDKPIFPQASDTPPPPEVTEQFKGFTEVGDVHHPISFFEPKDTAGIIDIDQSFQKLNVQIPSSLASMLNKKDYQFISCLENDKKAYGLYLHAGNTNSDYTESITSEMKKWENSMLKDLHNTLFPGAAFSESQLAQPLTFKDGIARFAPVSLPDGTQGSINYKINKDILYIASSISCLESSSNDSFDP